MTVRDSEQVVVVSGCKSDMSRSSLVSETISSEPDRMAAQVPGDPPHQFVNGSAAVIAGDVGVHFAPEPLDVVVLRAIGRQEVQPEPEAMVRQIRPDPVAGVDAVVVEHQVDAARPRMVPADVLKQRQEQVAASVFG